MALALEGNFPFILSTDVSENPYIKEKYNARNPAKHWHVMSREHKWFDSQQNLILKCSQWESTKTAYIIQE